MPSSLMLAKDLKFKNIYIYIYFKKSSLVEWWIEWWLGTRGRPAEWAL